TDSKENAFYSTASKIYDRINRSEIIANNDFPDSKDKIRHDGSRVYNTSYNSKSQQEIVRQFDNLINYEISPYLFSDKSVAVFESFIKGFADKQNIILILSPYHPKLYERIKNEQKIVIDMEKIFHNIAKKYKIKILGSYDPAQVGCKETDFYDGMHPRDNCMKRVLSYTRSVE
ncbi:MAG: hypothetical protein HQL49_12165, partial [Gammaproteobacteria bacterium]|nr:hypothetical protein [Gammaproteobacteria bacterium]